MKKNLIILFLWLFIVSSVFAEDSETTAIEMEEESASIEKLKNTAMNPEKLLFSINANPIGFLIFGPSITIEFTKGSFNSEMDFIIPTGLLRINDVGFGALVLFNYFWHSRIGGAYLGGGVGYVATQTRGYSFEHWSTIGLNAGYKFVTQSGLYFRTGVYFGLVVVDKFEYLYFYTKPELSIGWTMR